MMFLFLQMTIAVLFAMSLFHKMHKRSVSTYLILLLGFLWVIFSSLDAVGSLPKFKWASYGDIGLGIVSVGLMFIYWRSMNKPDTDKIL